MKLTTALLSTLVTAGALVTAGLPTATASAAIPPPCPPRAILETVNGQPALVIKDPTKPCAWIVIPIPVSPNL